MIRHAKQILDTGGGDLPGADMAQYGIAFVCVGGLFYLANKFIERWGKGDQTNMAEVVENNTEVMKQLIPLIQGIKETQARQGAQLEELIRKG